MADCWTIVFKCFLVIYGLFFPVMFFSIGFIVAGIGIHTISTPGTRSIGVIILSVSIISIMIGCSGLMMIVCYCAKRAYSSCLHNIKYRVSRSTCGASIAPRSGETEMNYSQQISAFTHIPSQLENRVFHVYLS